MICKTQNYIRTLFLSHFFLVLCPDSIFVILSLSLSLFLLVFQGRVSLYNSTDCPRTHSVDQAVLKLIEILLTLPPKC